MVTFLSGIVFYVNLYYVSLAELPPDSDTTLTLLPRSYRNFFRSSGELAQFAVVSCYFL